MVNQQTPIATLLSLALMLSACLPIQPVASSPTLPSSKESKIMNYELDDLKLRYEVFGEGQPVLMLHGRPLDRHSMIEAYEAIFSERPGWQRIYPDLPGMGETTGGSWIDSDDEVLAVLTQFMEHRYPGQNFLVVGFSYGGYLARGLLHEKPEQIDGMLLQAPSVPGKPEERILPPPRVIVPNPEGIAQFPPPLQEFLGSVLVVQTDEVLARQGVMIDGILRADQEMLKRIDPNRGFTFDPDDLSTPFEKPVLIITGKHDGVVGYEQAGDLLHHYPRATYAVLDRAGHGLHMEQPALFSLFVHEWLDRVEEEQNRASKS